MTTASKQAVKAITTAIAAVFFTPIASAAVASGDMENPVTGETEAYENTFTVGTEWNDINNWSPAEESKVPFVLGGNYAPALVNGSKTVSTSTAIDGWTLRVGAYNGAQVTWSGGISKIQAGSVGCWLTADETSSITIASFAGNQLEGSDSAPFKLSSANAGGITWSTGLTAASNTTLPFWYYLKGAGTVVYGGDITVANAQVIKQADITLSGTLQVASKTLVTFGSGTTKTFTADATIKRFTTVGGDLEDLSYDAHLATVTSDATTLTTDDAVGTCELVQTTTGIVLYWVDGDPGDMPPPTVYKPSININFTSGTALSVAADVGLGDYAIPGTSWNNLIGNNGTLSALNAVDSTGVAYATAASVTISGTRGYYYCSSLTAASDLRQGYIDESTSGLTPTVTVSGIPYEKYRVVVYTATDAPDVGFGYITVNGKDYTYVEGSLTEGTTAWGASGARDTAEVLAEGVNVLVSPVTLGSTLTVVGHRSGNNPRGCIAAIQIVEFVPEIGENDLVIPVMGDTTYTVDAQKTLSGTVYLVGDGTLTLDGSEKITASTIDVSKNVILNVNADRLDGTTFAGSGTVVYNNSLPVTGKGWTESTNWVGTVWINGKSSVTDFNVNSYGNANSAVKLSGVDGWVSAPFDNTVPVILENGTFDYALKLTDGHSPNNQYPTRCTTFVKVSGSGTIADGTAANPMLKIYDGTEFTGAITLTRARVVFCSATSTTLPEAYTSIPTASIYVDAGNSVTVASGNTWTANGGFIVDGTLNVDGTLASSHATKAVSGSGKVVFTGRAPTVSGDAWWKNEAWTGTVTVKSVTNLIGTSGTGTYIDFNEYGNAGSVIELDSVTGWLNPGYVCNVPFKITGTLSLTNGYSDKANAFKVGTLLGSGTISGSGSAVRAVFNVTTDWSGFTGNIGLDNKCVVFGETIPDTITAGQIYISEGAVVTNNVASGNWWAVGGIKVDGELCAPNLDKFGGGTTITTGDNGVFTLTSTGNGTAGETNTDYARITGTGSLKYEGLGWRALSTNNFPTAMTLIDEQAGDILLSSALTYTVGSLAGTKNLQGNYGSGARYMRVLQAKDTEWSGIVIADGSDRFKGLTVAPGASTAGTLTLSGTQVKAQTLTVESGAKVNLTGTWKGATTVAGTFGGTGTLTGNLTLTDGATINVSDISDPLAVSGSLTATGAITIELPEGSPMGMIITTGSKPDISGATFTTKVGGVEKRLKVTATAGGLKVGAQSLLIRIR